MKSFSQQPAHVTVSKMEPYEFGNKCTVCNAPATRYVQIGAHWGSNQVFHFCAEHTKELVKGLE